MSEIVEFVHHGAAQITPKILRGVHKKLPFLKMEFTQIDAPKYPHLVEQLEFLADVVEDFADGKGSNETKFVCGDVERIPERLEHASAFLGEHLFGPDSFINLSLPGFERLETGRKLVADPAAETAGLDRDGGIAPR